MHVFEHRDPGSLAVRSHPWSGSLSDTAHRYYDLRREPGLIRSALEDFRGWERYPAIETFYRLLEWLNGPESALETNDCAFCGPTANEHAGFAKALQCSGRLMLLFRELALNMDNFGVHAFTDRLARALSREDEDLEWGVAGMTIVPVRFTTLPGAAEDQLGHQLMLSFWAWGDTEGETMANLERTLVALVSVLHDARRWCMAPVDPRAKVADAGLPKGPRRTGDGSEDAEQGRAEVQDEVPRPELGGLREVAAMPGRHHRLVR